MRPDGSLGGRSLRVGSSGPGGVVRGSSLSLSSLTAGSDGVANGGGLTAGAAAGSSASIPTDSAGSHSGDAGDGGVGGGEAGEAGTTGASSD